MACATYMFITIVVQLRILQLLTSDWIVVRPFYLHLLHDLQVGPPGFPSHRPTRSAGSFIVQLFIPSAFIAQVLKKRRREILLPRTAGGSMVVSATGIEVGVGVKCIQVANPLSLDDHMQIHVRVHYELVVELEMRVLQMKAKPLKVLIRCQRVAGTTPKLLE